MVNTAVPDKTCDSWTGLQSTEGMYVFLVNIPSRLQHSSITKDSVCKVMKGIWFVFTLYTLVMKLTKLCFHFFPENNLSLLTKRTDQMD